MDTKPRHRKRHKDNKKKKQITGRLRVVQTKRQAKGEKDKNKGLPDNKQTK